MADGGFISFPVEQMLRGLVLTVWVQ